MSQRVKNLPAMQETQEMQVLSLGREGTLEEGIETHSPFLPGESHGQRSLAGYMRSQRVRHNWETKQARMHGFTIEVTSFESGGPAG